MSHRLVMGTPGNGFRSVSESFFPFNKVHGAGKWREHDKLRKCDVGPFGYIFRGHEGGGVVAGQAKNERSEHMDAMLPEGSKALHQIFSGQIEILVNVLQTFRGDRFHAHQSAYD